MGAFFICLTVGIPTFTPTVAFIANIVADIIMEFNKEVGKYLENDGVYITGGIIESREDEVLLSFAQNGFEVKERFEEKGWLVFVVKKSK